MLRMNASGHTDHMLDGNAEPRQLHDSVVQRWGWDIVSGALPPGSRIVAEDAAGQPIGYASGHIEPDGEGYVDFMAVCPDARGLGDGRRLLAAVCQEVLQRSRVRRVNLTVDTRRRPAIQLYEAFGFSRVASIGGHRSVKPQPTPA